MLIRGVFILISQFHLTFKNFVNMQTILLIAILFCVFQGAFSIWCFECVSTQPGCGKTFNWWFMWSQVCPEDYDVCVKVTERKGAEVVTTRGCLSTIKGIRTDIPADSYEGCRPAAKDLKLGHYVNNTIKELDIHRDYYDTAEYCFCFLDHRCNNSSYILPSIFLLAACMFAPLYRQFTL